MKVVINDCFGGFSLSHEAIMRYAELKGIKLYPWFDEITKKVYGERARIDNPEVNGWLHYSTVPKEEYKKIEEEEREKPVGKGRYEKTNDVYFSDRSIERTDPLLFKIIKELGKKKASGRCASLKVITIPDDVEWEIEEYDGWEHIAEKHRTWH